MAVEYTNEQQEEIIDDFSFDLSKPHVSREQIESITGFKPININLYRVSLVHKSLQKILQNRISLNIKVCDYMNDTNERLEFLGDSVINFVSANYIFNKYPDKDEGFMTRIRTKIVRSSHCVKFAKFMNLEQHILTSNKVLNIKDRMQINNRVLEDAFEAFIGALYKDLGFRYAEMFINGLIDKCVDEILKDDNYKDIIMRYSQAYGYELPIYETISSVGPPYSRKFVISISLMKDGFTREMGQGTGLSKKEAEQNAAKNACNMIDSSLKHIINRDQ